MKINKLAGSVIVVFFVAVNAMAQTPDTDWYTANPGATSFTISTADELAGLAAIVNGTWGGVPERDGFEGKTITLTANVDLSPYDNWVAIGLLIEIYTLPGEPVSPQIIRHPFSGTFDGGRHIISNLTIDRPSEWRLGLFGYVSGGKVENVGLDGVSIIGGWSVGGIVGWLENSSVANCYTTGAISNTGPYLGGIAGLVSDSSVISNSYSVAAVSGSNVNGGIAGSLFNNSSVTNCAALNPEVKSTGWYLDAPGRGYGIAGRIVGNNSDGTLSNNVAYIEIMNGAGNITWTNKGAADLDGEDITIANIRADGTIGGRFTDTGGWTTESGKLPGFAAAVEFPWHFTVLIHRVIISPADVLVSRGRTQQFTAAAFGVSEDKTVAWAVSGNSSGLTAINADGLLSIAADETAMALAVIATSTVNTEVSDTVAVAVIDTRWYVDAIAANPGETHFTVSGAHELGGLAQIVNGTWGGKPERDSFSGKTIMLAGDIDLSQYDNWEPIGSPIKPFSGTLNGGGHVISNLTINRLDNFQGLFGGIISGSVENLGLDNVSVSGHFNVGGLAGFIDSSRVSNCYSTGTVIGTGDYVGGLVGYVENSSSITNCYFSGTVSGTLNGTGGVVGYLWLYSNVANCYSTGTVRGDMYVGGVIGGVGFSNSVTNCYSTSSVIVYGSPGSGGFGLYAYVGGLFGSVLSSSSVSNCAALNSEVKGNGSFVEPLIGYSYITPSNSVIFKGIHSGNGNITATEINADGTIRGLFTNTDIWTIEPGKLPGLFGKAVDMPAHLHPDYISIASPNRVIPQDNGNNDIAIIAPVNPPTTKFTAGPNPVGKSSGPVNFYYHGKSIKNGTLTIYDASGNIVTKIKIRNNPLSECRGGNLPPAVSDQPRHPIGSWDLMDRKGRPVAEGTYLARGVIVTSDGKRERVSVVVGVR